jgi:hypothetical protein
LKPSQKNPVSSSHLLCELGLHKWRNCGDIVQVSWQEEGLVVAPRQERLSGVLYSEAKSKAVYSKRQCLRCGMKLKRKFWENSDGTISCSGWELDTEEIQQDNMEPSTSRISRRTELGLLANIVFALGVLAVVVGSFAASGWQLGESFWAFIVLLVPLFTAYVLIRLLTRPL